MTQFFLGLMSFYRESLEDGRLPVWNDLWGYGFPGLAESQMGVFYPVHVVLYRWLNTETAYVVSLLVHTLWGGAGCLLGGTADRDFTARRRCSRHFPGRHAASSWFISLIRGDTRRGAGCRGLGGWVSA